MRNCHATKIKSLQAKTIYRIQFTQMHSSVRILPALPRPWHGSPAPQNDAMQSDGAVAVPWNARRSRSFRASFFASTGQQFMLSVFCLGDFVCALKRTSAVIGFVLHQYAKSNQIMSAQMACDMDMRFPFGG